ncbi:hypothetical protein [Peijinzhouia sedimentorum]
MDKLKIAVVKQVVYQDLYVAANGSNAAELLFSSMGRVGPIGFFTLHNADFIITKETSDPESRHWEKILATWSKNGPDDFRKLNHTTLDKIPGQEFKSPGVNIPPGDFAVEPSSIDWAKYDVVICMNFAVPQSIILQYPNVLWTYMIAEANRFMDKVYYDYDCSLNQESRGIIANSLGILDFPYTYLGPYCLEEILKKELGRESLKNGVYAEVNVVKERPVKIIPHYEPLKDTGHPIRVHQQLIKDNLREVFDAKYFLKVGGRPTRGNSVAEAISLGTLVLMAPEDLIHTQLLPKETWVRSVAEAKEKIIFLDNHPEEYIRLLALQRQLVKHFIQDCPWQSIENAHKAKLSRVSITSPLKSKKTLFSKLFGSKN